MHKSKLNIATQAALSAGKLINQRYERLDSIRVAQKGRNDFVTDVDKIAESAIIDTIQEAFPAHDIITEESQLKLTGSEYCWIIDPLDGTNNFIHGLPYFSISIALQHNKETVVAVIYNPINDELFSAIKGSGAQLNSQRIRVATTKAMSHALIAAGFTNREGTDINTHTRATNQVLQSCSALRQTGSAALDLAHVACGRLDGYWASQLRPWDIAAGTLLITESGGIVTDFNKGNLKLSKGEIITGTPRVHAELVEILSNQRSN